MQEATLYTGVKEVSLTDEELCDFYNGDLKIDLLLNEYLLIKNKDGEILDKYKKEKDKVSKLKYKSFDSQLLGKIKPRNQRQEILMDLLCSEAKLLSISGVAGAGKTYLTTAHAIQELQKENYRKIVIIRNNVNIPDVPELGILPGDTTEKLKQSCAFMGDIITDFFFDSFLRDGKIEICYLGNMRSRSISDSYILCNESQNLNTSLVKMIITRVGENSRLVFDFDLSQIDKKSFEKDNGMLAMNEALKGNELFGACELDLIERSEVAKLASLIN